MKKPKPNNRKLSLYLVKSEYKDFKSVIRSQADEYEVKRGSRVLGTLYVKPMSGQRPAWFSLFDGSIQQSLQDTLKSRSVSAVFLLKRDGRIFALTFGYGRSLLKQGAWEEQFGLKVVLNSIDRDKIRVIDRKNLDTMLTHTRTQTSRKCAIEEFNLDVQQILLKAVMGEPREKTLGSSISGADALSIICQVTLDTIEDKCDHLLKAFESQDYKKSFPWVNNVSEVTNKKTIQELDNQLVERIKAKKWDRLFLAVPEIVEWTNIDGFKFKESDNEVHPDILLPDFFNAIHNPEYLSSQYLRQRHVFQVSAESGMAEPRWSVYHCLNCEITNNEKAYILTESKWYEINSSFVSRVNARVKAVNKYSIQIAAKKDEKESDYCRRLCESDPQRYALMDQEMIQYGGGHSRMEFCDVFTKHQELIHIKRYSGSSVLSHLFSQGVNCARVFISDLEFCERVNQKLPTSHKFVAKKLPVSKDHNIVFAIISETADHLPESLPFFSKISLMRATQELQDVMGFKVSLAGIEVSA